MMLMLMRKHTHIYNNESHGQEGHSPAFLHLITCLVTHISKALANEGDRNVMQFIKVVG